MIESNTIKEVLLFPYKNESVVPTSRVGMDRFVSKDYHPVAHANSLAEKIEALNLKALVFYGHDFRTEIGPFALMSFGMLFAGPCEVGGLLSEAGFETRIVQQSWNPFFSIKHAKLSGQAIDLLAISSMQIHQSATERQIKISHKLGGKRPLVICGGPSAIYGWQTLWDNGDDKAPDVAVTGESYIVLELIELLVSQRQGGESLLNTFNRIKKDNPQLLYKISGLVFRAFGKSGSIIHTGTPRLLPKLESRPTILVGLSLYQKPSLKTGLSKDPVPLSKIHRYIHMLAMPGFTAGCIEVCDFCPIPDRFQGTYRTVDPEFIGKELREIYLQTGIKSYFFGDDSLAGNHNYVEKLWSCLSEVDVNGKKLGEIIWIGTEAILADIQNLIKKKPGILRKAKDGGFNAFWFGIEALNTDNVNKGQAGVNIQDVFSQLREAGIQPMAMTILFQTQEWRSKNKDDFGVVETVKELEQNEVVSYQNLHITPSVGSPAWKGHFQRREVFSEVAWYKLEPYWFSGNQVILGKSKLENGEWIPVGDDKVWRRQLQIICSYWLFYNPFKVLGQYLNYLDSSKETADIMWRAFTWRAFGFIQTLFTTIHILPWLFALWAGPWKRVVGVPKPKFEILTTMPEQKIRTRIEATPHTRTGKNSRSLVVIKV